MAILGKVQPLLAPVLHPRKEGAALAMRTVKKCFDNLCQWQIKEESN
jgi:hypothetical protein